MARHILGKVLLVGDSICIDYCKYLRKYLDKGTQLVTKSGVAEAYKNLDIATGANGGDSARVLEYVTDLENKNIIDFDFFFFNCGLHDIKRNELDGKYQVDVSKYKENLQNIVDIMERHNVKVYFITTTMADRTRYPEGSDFVRYNEDVVEYNKVAKEVMERKKVNVVDLYKFTDSLELKGDDLFRDHTHFNQEVITLQAAYLAGVMDNLLIAK